MADLLDGITRRFPLIGTGGFPAPVATGLRTILIHSKSDVAEARKIGIEIDLEDAGPIPAGTPRLTIRIPEGISRKLKITVGPRAHSNEIIINGDKGLYGRIFIQGSHNVVVDMGSIRAATAISFGGSRGFIYWGPSATSNGLFVELRRNEDAFIVGEDCMFAPDVVVRPTDMHGVFSLESGEVLNTPSNPNRPIILFPHVWIGHRAVILKGVTIGPGAIVATSAVVTKNVAPGVAVGGNPAKVLSREVSWSRTPEPNTDEVHRVTGYVNKAIGDFELYVESLKEAQYLSQ